MQERVRGAALAMGGGVVLPRESELWGPWNPLLSKAVALGKQQ